MAAQIQDAIRLLCNARDGVDSRLRGVLPEHLCSAITVIETAPARIAALEAALGDIHGMAGRAMEVEATAKGDTGTLVEIMTKAEEVLNG